MASLVSLAIILVVLALIITVGVVKTKRRVKRRLPGDEDTHVEG